MRNQRSGHPRDEGFECTVATAVDPLGVGMGLVLEQLSRTPPSPNDVPPAAAGGSGKGLGPLLVGALAEHHGPVLSRDPRQWSNARPTCQRIGIGGIELGARGSWRAGLRLAPSPPRPRRRPIALDVDTDLALLGGVYCELLDLGPDPFGKHPVIRGRANKSLEDRHSKALSPIDNRHALARRSSQNLEWRGDR